MEILCVSDFVDPIVYSPHAKERFKNIDLVLAAGDLPMEYLDFIASILNKPILFVFGNHNLENMNNFRRKQQDEMEINEVIKIGHFGATHIDRKIVKIKSILIAGLGGSIKYNNGPNQFTNFHMWLRVLGLVPRLWWNRIFYGRFLDILLTHSAPFGIGDKDDPCHIGFKSFTWFIKRFKPKYLLHGHIHLYDSREPRARVSGKTEVINVYSHYKLSMKDSENV